MDRFVLLALDRAYRSDSSPDIENTRLAVENNYMANWALANPKALFGANIHPFRLDAPAELARLVQRGACLIKWIPSAQNIVPDENKLAGFSTIQVIRLKVRGRARIFLFSGDTIVDRDYWRNPALAGSFGHFILHMLMEHRGKASKACSRPRRNLRSISVWIPLF